MIGFVSIVGAGPGDPELLTQKAVTRLRCADFVLYDALVDSRVLRHADHAQRFYVGKRGGHGSMAQETINGLMIRAARRGRRVVRLKGGDPFVFGRGGEEALALRAAGVPFEVVPGVSSAVAAPALAGIPVTHRGMTRGFVVVTGHDQAAFADASSAIAPNSLTLVVLMGLARRAAISKTLIDAGWRTDTPAAVIVGASAEHQTIWRGTLSEMDQPIIDDTSAGTIVIGRVASLDATSRAAEIPLRTNAGAHHVSCR